MTLTRPLDRRTFLRASGVALGLPLLESMAPALARAAAVEAPRIHCSLDGMVSLEASRIRDDVPSRLLRHGFEVVPREAFSFYMGCVQMVVRDHGSGLLTGVADPRRDGAAGGPTR